MTTNDLLRMPVQRLLRLRSHAHAELEETPDYLYPLLHMGLLRRVAAINRVLAWHHEHDGTRVELRPGYDAAGPLEDALRPQRRPPRG